MAPNLWELQAHSKSAEHPASHCGAGIRRSFRRIRNPNCVRRRARGRRRRAGGAGARMPLEELGVMLCVWLAWGAQLAQMALQSQREDE